MKQKIEAELDKYKDKGLKYSFYQRRKINNTASGESGETLGEDSYQYEYHLSWIGEPALGSFESDRDVKSTIEDIFPGIVKDDR